jgi:hypothetical protein
VIDQKSQGQQAGQTQGGQGQYPVDNQTYNLMQVVVSKLESIEAYGKYMKDGDQKTKQLFQELIDQDRATVQKLMDSLKACMR